jgi:hypothetical protein
MDWLTPPIYQPARSTASARAKEKERGKINIQLFWQILS